MNDSLFQLIQKFTRRNRIRLHEEELKLQLTSHPSYPSLHSVTGVLEHFNVPHVAVRLPQNPEMLEHLTTSFLATRSTDQGDELVIAEPRTGMVKITNSKLKKETLSKRSFLDTWTGIVVAIEKDEQTQQVKNSIPNKIVIAMAALLLVACSIYVVYELPHVFAQGHFLLSMVGLAVSILISRHEIGFGSQATDTLCNVTEQASCDTVLNSKGARLWGGIKLSDLSLVVFATLCLSWIAYVQLDINQSSLFEWATLLALPVVAYSVYYQANVVKKWCPLCMGVVCVLLLQFGFLWIGGISMSPISLDIIPASIWLVSAVLATAIWSQLKPLLQNKKDYGQLRMDHHKFKRNFSLFEAAHRQGQQLIASDYIPGEIVFGPDTAPIEMILVSSPYCHYCKAAHTDLEHLLDRSEGKLKVTLRFRVDVEEKDNPYKLVSQLLHRYHTQGSAAILRTMQELYKEDADPDAWLKSNELRFNPGYDRIMQLQSQWCDDNAINFTPALFLNGVQYPNAYDRKDLLLFVDQLIESQTVTKTERVAS